LSIGSDSQHPWAVGTARVSLAVLAEEGVADIRWKLDGQGKVNETATGAEWHYSFAALWFPGRADFRPVQEFNLRQLSD
jgi:hypothetical protein